MRPLRGLQETRVATREESGVLGFPSRRGLTPRGPSGCEGKLGVALESLQGRRDLTYTQRHIDTYTHRRTHKDINTLTQKVHTQTHACAPVTFPWVTLAGFPSPHTPPDIPTHPTSQIPRDGCLACNTPPPQAPSGPAMDTEAPKPTCKPIPRRCRPEGSPASLSCCEAELDHGVWPPDSVLCD